MIENLRQTTDVLVEFWAQDEHRVGLKPIVRRVWSPVGQRPIVKVHPRYQWLYEYAFVQPSTGHSLWLLMPTVSIDAFNVALAEFARDVGAGPDKIVVLLIDRAGWHISPDVVCPEGIRVYFLPAYSPELQPAEHLWKLADEPLFNRCPDNLQQLEDWLAERCSWLQDHPEIVRSTTNFHWLPH